MMKLPKYIGHPCNSNAPNQAALDTDGITFEQKITQSLQIAYIQPLDTQISKDINIYTGKNAWDEYGKRLENNGVARPTTVDTKRANHIACVCSVLTPLSETFNNEYGQSDALSPLQSFNSNDVLQDASFIAGGLDAKGLRSRDSALANALGSLLETAGKTAGWVGGKIGGVIGADSQSIERDVREAITNPATKLDIPTLWRGNSYSCSYDLSIKLTCFNARNDSDFGTNIVAPLIALLQFVAPRSEGGKFYKWPFLMKMTIPGTVYMPLGYCSSMTILKGGDVNDISWCGRPNMVDIRMSVTSVYNTCVNAAEGDVQSDRPNLRQQVEAMMAIDDRGGLKDSQKDDNTARSTQASTQMFVTKGNSSNNNAVPSRAMSEEQKAAAEVLNAAANTNLTR